MSMTVTGTALSAFSSGHSRAQWVTILLAANAVLSLISIASTNAQIELINAAQHGGSISDAAAAANDDRQQLIAILQVALLAATAVVFLRWLHRVYNNLKAFGVSGLSFTPGWAVGSFFIPVLNLYRPYRAVAEAWKASNPDLTLGDGASWKRARGSAIITVWWALWLILNVSGQILSRSSPEPDTLDSFIRQSWMLLLDDGLNILAAIFAILVVRAIDARQEERHKRILGWAGPPTQVTLA